MKYDELIKELREAGKFAKSALVNPYRFVPYYFKAADALEELTMKLHGDEAAIAGMKQQIERMVVNPGNKPKWIPVSERLPEEGRYVLVAYETIAGFLCHVSMLWTYAT